MTADPDLVAPSRGEAPARAWLRDASRRSGGGRRSAGRPCGRVLAFSGLLVLALTTERGLLMAAQECRIYSRDVSSQQLTADEQRSLGPSRDATVRYRRPGYEVAVHQDGRLWLRASGPGARGELLDYRCSTRVPTGTVDELFLIVRSQGFLSSRNEYLPRPGTFAYSGHDVRKTVAVESPAGTPIHTVTFSDRPAVPPPRPVEAAARAVERIVWEIARDQIERECEAIPAILLGID